VGNPVVITTGEKGRGRWWLCMASGVYRITNRENRKIYVGSTKDLFGRWNTHLRLLRKGINPCLRLQEAYNEFGEEAFVFMIIEIVKDKYKLKKENKFG